MVSAANAVPASLPLFFLHPPTEVLLLFSRHLQLQGNGPNLLDVMFGHTQPPRSSTSNPSCSDLGGGARQEERRFAVSYLLSRDRDRRGRVGILEGTGRGPC